MKSGTMRRRAALGLTAAVLLSAGASARNAQPGPEEGAPIARELEVHTYRGIPCEGQFLASDGEGDDLTFTVEEPPRKGSVTVEGANFTYTPRERAVGADSFTYAAADSAGHVSQPARVTVSIERSKSGIAYADTGDSGAAAAAQYLAEEGIFTGACIGGTYYFEPERPVTRGEFLAMVLETLGMEALSVTMTGFADDGAIPVWAKGCAAAGAAEGLIRGRNSAAGASFAGEDPITGREAAAVLDRALGTAGAEAGDRRTPAGTLVGGALPEEVTRADAARMLAAAHTLLKEGEEGLLERLR